MPHNPEINLPPFRAWASLACLTLGQRFLSHYNPVHPLHRRLRRQFWASARNSDPVLSVAAFLRTSICTKMVSPCTGQKHVCASLQHSYGQAKLTSTNHSQQKHSPDRTHSLRI